MAVPAYEVRNLVKRYAPDQPPANDGISLDICQGEVFGLLGPNGAGKTTLVRWPRRGGATRSASPARGRRPSRRSCPDYGPRFWTMCGLLCLWLLAAGALVVRRLDWRND